MFGWLRLAAACASRRNRSTNDGSPGVLGEERLQRDRAVQRLVAGEVHLGHAALRDLALDLVAVRKDLADQRHRGETLSVHCRNAGRGEAPTASVRGFGYAPSSARSTCCGDRRGDAAAGRLRTASNRRARRAPRSRTAGRSAGANAMNHACGGSSSVRSPRSRSCPRPGCPGSARRCRCPRLTTSSMQLRMVAAVAGSIARCYSFERYVWTTRAVGVLEHGRRCAAS